MIHNLSSQQQMPIYILIGLIISCCICCACCCSFCSFTGGFDDWVNSGCLSNEDATEEEKTACQASVTEDSCLANTNCYWKPSILVQITDTVYPSESNTNANASASANANANANATR